MGYYVIQKLGKELVGGEGTSYGESIVSHIEISGSGEARQFAPWPYYSDITRHLFAD